MPKRTDISKILILGSGPIMIGTGSIGFERARLKGAPFQTNTDQAKPDQTKPSGKVEAQSPGGRFGKIAS